jgi:transposase
LDADHPTNGVNFPCLNTGRRKFVDVHKAQGSAIADEAIRRIAELYAVEKVVRGLPRKRPA